MNHCKNCKYWEEETWPSDKPKEVNRCAYPKQLWNASEWVELENIDKFGRDGIRVINELNKNTLAFVQDGSDYKANLFTRAEFGCVAFVEKLTFGEPILYFLAKNIELAEKGEYIAGPVLSFDEIISFADDNDVVVQYKSGQLNQIVGMMMGGSLVSTT